MNLGHDMPTEVRQELLALPHPQLRIVLYYLLSQERDENTGVLMKPGKTIAEEMGMNRSLFARTIRGLAEDGWLAPAERFANITYYALGERIEPSTSNVVPMRQRTA